MFAVVQWLELRAQSREFVGSNPTSDMMGTFLRPPPTQGELGGGPRVVVSTVAFHARVRGSFPDLGGLHETKMFLPHPLVKLSIKRSLRD